MARPVEERVAAALPALSASLSEARNLTQAGELLFGQLREQMGACRTALLRHPRHSADRVQINGAQPEPFDPTWLHERGLDIPTVMGPFSTISAQQPEGRAFRQASLVPADNERMQWLVSVVQQWLDVDGCMSVNLFNDREHLLRLTVCDANPLFGADEVRFFQGITPLLRCGLRGVMLQEKADMLMSGLDASNDLRDVVTVLLYQDLSLAWATTAFRARLAPFFGNFDGVLPPPILAWLLSSSLVALHARRTPDPVERIFSTSHDALRARATVIRTSTGRNGILVELTPARRPERRPRLRALGLTPREVDVALLLPNGATNTEMGKHLGIREVTVKKHLRAIGDKLGATGKVEILARLTGIIAHPDWPESPRA